VHRPFVTLECGGHHDDDVRRTEFPTLQAALFCLAGCITSDE